MFGQLDRHLKQGVVDQDAAVVSASLVGGLHLSQANPELVKRWTNEIQSALKSAHHMVQYHALALSYKLRFADSLAVSKLVQGNISSLRSPLAHCMLIRYCARLLKEENNRQGERTKEILPYLESCLVYKNDMIILEAAKAIVEQENTTPKDLTATVTALQSFLSSAKPVHKFAALRLLNKLANRFPLLTSLVNFELERIVEDERSSKSLATLAITTLLKTGNEVNIDRLIKQISGFMSSIQDDSKVVVIDAIKSLCVKYPKRFHVMLSFLNQALREEGGYPYKKVIVDTITHLLEKIPDAKEQGVAAFCEFIEDCEFTLLLQQVLHYIGEVGPTLPKPARCIRFIYNRVLLESAPVRASAVLTLAKFAARVPDLRRSIIVILRRTMQDNDDEVRDRAVFYLRVLETGDEALIQKMITEDLQVNVGSLEKTLVKYLQQNNYESRFDLALVAEQEKEDALAEGIRRAREAQQAKASGAELPGAAAAPAASASAARAESPVGPGSSAIAGGRTAIDYKALFGKIPQLAKLGTPFKSSLPFPLTEADSDYVVSCVKHVFPSNIVFQFNVTNKVNSQRLENVVVAMDTGAVAGLREEFAVQVAALPFENSEAVFVCTSREPGVCVGLTHNTLQFNVRNVDPETGEPEDESEDADADEFELEDMPIAVTDFLKETQINIKEEWEKMGADRETVHGADLGRQTLQQSIDRVVAYCGLAPLNDRTPSRPNAHILYFAGQTIDRQLVLAVAKFSEQNGAVVLQTAVRADDEPLRRSVIRALVPGTK